MVCESDGSGGRNALTGLSRRVLGPILAGAQRQICARAQRQVLETLDRLKSIIADVEAQRRGYLLTLDPSYLKAYGVSDESVRRDAQALQALVASDPLQNHRAGHLALTVAAKLREIDDIVKTAQTSSGPAALALIAEMTDKSRRPDGGPRRFLLVDQEGRRGTRTSQAGLTRAVVLSRPGMMALALARREAIGGEAIAENVALTAISWRAQEDQARSTPTSSASHLGSEGAFLRPMTLSPMVGYDRDDLTAGSCTGQR